MTRLDRSSHSGGGHAKGSRPLNSLVAGHRVAQPPSASGSRASVQVGVCGETGGWGRHLGGLRIRVTVGTRCPVRAREVGLSSTLRIMLYGRYLPFNI